MNANTKFIDILMLYSLENSITNIHLSTCFVFDLFW